MDLASLPLPPGRMGLPLVGETLQYLRDPVAFGDERRRRYGNIYKTHLFGRPAVVISSPEDVRFIFANEYRYLRAQWPEGTRVLLGEGSVATQQGELHKARRKIMMQAFSSRILAEAVPEMDRLVQYHLRRWHAQRDLEWSPLFSALTFHLACALIFGVDRELTELAQEFGDWSTGLFSLAIPLPWTKFGRAKQARERLIARISSIVRERRRAFDDAQTSQTSKTDQSEEARDAFTALLRARDESGQPLSEAELCDQALVLIFAGHETTASALTSMGLMLAQRPDILARLRQEQEAIDLSGRMTIDDIDRMPYMGQVIKEVLRRYTPVSAGFRDVIESFELGGYQIPKGWTISYSMINSHRDAESFPSPEVFDPERFSPERAEDRRVRFSHIPFGGGPRLCIGMEFARLEMHVVGARLVREYDWALAPRQDVSIQYKPMPRPKDGLRVRFTRRARTSAAPTDLAT